MLYTRRGDEGDTAFFGGCGRRFSKSSAVAEALGALDELNSFLGVCRARREAREVRVGDDSVAGVLRNVQHRLFIIQAEVAGADKHLPEGEVRRMEGVVAEIEKRIPPVKSFSLPGGTEYSAMVDVARTLARKAERRIVAARDEGFVHLSGETLPYMNRLSSLLFALVRLINHEKGVRDEAPHY